MRKRGAEGEQFKLQSRGMETFHEDKRSVKRRQQLVQEKVQMSQLRKDGTGKKVKN